MLPVLRSSGYFEAGDGRLLLGVRTTEDTEDCRSVVIPAEAGMTMG
jgi:hypothetical protein